MKSGSRLALVFVGILLLMGCAILIGVGGYVWLTLAQPAAVAMRSEPTWTATRTRSATAAETTTSTPAATHTLVIQPGTPLPQLGVVGKTPTRSAPYSIAGITPVIPIMKNAIGFASSFKVVTYPVTGSTVEQLSQSLERNALRDSHDSGNYHYALTAWFLSAHWEDKPAPAGCEVGHADMTMTITVTLPLVDNPSSLPPDVALRWNTFISNTITHEMQHVKLSMDGATEYRRALGNFLPAMDCDLLKRQLNDLFKREYTQIDNANVDYDNKTNHGATQGAVLPGRPRRAH